MADADERTLDRREFLERSGKVAVAAAVASQPAWLAACGSSHHHAASASTTAASPADWSHLAKLLHGQLLMAGDPAYAKTAKPYNELYSAVRPHGIAVCADAADARQALLWAKETGQTFTVMSGSHSYAGYSTCRGLVIDMSRLNKLHFDPSDGRVKIGVGVRNHQIFSALPPHHVGLPHGRCPHTGVGGFVLGGGFG